MRSEIRDLRSGICNLTRHTLGFNPYMLRARNVAVPPHGTLALLACLLCAETTPAIGQENPMATPEVQEMIRYAAARGEGTWKKAQGPAPNLTSRELFTCALALAEARTHPERLGPLFRLAVRMHDRDPESRGYGNFRWSWSHNQVMDFNAVEFCMQGGRPRGPGPKSRAYTRSAGTKARKRAS